MKIETKYSLGDTVWYISQDTLEKKLACSVCNDTKEVTIKDIVFKCPNCVGKHNNSRWLHRYYVVGSSKIGQVRTEFTKADSNFDREASEKIEYMLRQTGVGTGTLWLEEKLFATKAEAQKYCDLKNEEADKFQVKYLEL